MENPNMTRLISISFFGLAIATLACFEPLWAEDQVEHDPFGTEKATPNKGPIEHDPFAKKGKSRIEVAFQTPKGVAKDGRRLTLTEAFDGRITLDFKNAPLEKALKAIGKATSHEFRLLQSTLDEVGIGPYTLVTIQLKNITLRSALQHLLQSVDPATTYRIMNGVVLITSQEEAEENLVTKVYRVGDLAALPSNPRLKRRIRHVPDQSSLSKFDLDLIINTICRSVVAGSWDKVGGPASINGCGDLLIVRQTLQGHEKVGQLLRALQAARDAHGKLSPILAASPVCQSAEKKIHASLEKKVGFEFTDKPLGEVVEVLKKLFNISMVIDTWALDEVGAGIDTPVTFVAKNDKAQTGLDEMLRKINPALTFAIRDEVLVITIQEEAEERLATKVYRVGDLAALPSNPRLKWRIRHVPDQSSLSQFDLDLIINTICESVVMDSWDKVGGPASIIGCSDLLIVSQTFQGHEKVGQLLQALQAARDANGKLSPILIASPTCRSAEKKIHAALDKKVGFEFTDRPLDEVVDMLEELLDISISINVKALNEVGIDHDVPVTFATKNARAITGLERILRHIDPTLTFAIRDEVLMITTHEDAEENLKVVVYPAGGLTQHGDGSDALGYKEFDALVETIRETIEPDAWAEGNSPDIAVVGSCRALVIPQTDEIHRQIAALFKQLHAAQSQQTPRKIEAVVEAPSKPTKSTETHQVVIYHLKTSHSDSVRRSRKELIPLIKELVEPKTWSSKETIIRVVEDRLVVRQRASAHAKIEHLLSELQLLRYEQTQPVRGFSPSS